MLKRSKPSFSGQDSKSGEVRRCNLGGQVPIALEQRDSRQVTPVPVCLQRILSFTGGHISNFDKSFLKVHLMNGTVCVVRCLDETKVEDVIRHVIDHLSGGQKSQRDLYGLLAVCETPDVKQWLLKDMTMSDCYRELHSMHPAPDKWRFDLKIRFFFSTVVDLLQTDRIAFFYLFDQVRNYLREQNTYEKLEKDVAIELVSLEIRLILKDRIPKTPNRKVNSVAVEEQEWRKHLPLCFLPGTDAKTVSKSMQKSLKSSFGISEEECILKYLNIVSCFWRYFEESFECQFDNLTSAPSVKVIVGPTVGIVYETTSEPVLMTLAKFNKIKTVETQDVDYGQLKITFHDGRSPVILRCLPKCQNKQLEYLIYGYCVLLTAIEESSFESGNESAPDYAILEENVENDILLPVIKNSSNSSPGCTCPKMNEMNSSVLPFSSTPDLLSNAGQSSDSRSSISLHTGSCGSTSDEINIDQSSVSVYSDTIISQSNKPSIVSSLTIEVIEEKLRLQKQQSDDDAAWLHREEANRIIGENNIKSPKKIIDYCDDILNISSNSISKPQVEPSDIPVDLLNKVKLDRSSDTLYCATTSLVQSIVDLKCAVQHGETDSLVGSAKAVGVQLRTMLSVVHSEVSSLSPQIRHEVEMAQKTLSSDLGHLIDAMKMVLHYSPTDLAQDYRCKMLQLGHTLAVDAKTLFDTIDTERKKMFWTQDPMSSALVCDASDTFSPISEASCEHE